MLGFTRLCLQTIRQRLIKKRNKRINKNCNEENVNKYRIHSK